MPNRDNLADGEQLPLSGARTKPYIPRELVARGRKLEKAMSGGQDLKNLTINSQVLLCLTAEWKEMLKTSKT